jgi:hypothetical protein
LHLRLLLEGGELALLTSNTQVNHAEIAAHVTPVRSRPEA